MADDARQYNELPAPKLQVGSTACKCAACGKVFRALRGFDKHRVTEWLIRRCLTTHELIDKGWTQDKHGYWRMPRRGKQWQPSTQKS